MNAQDCIAVLYMELICLLRFPILGSIAEIAESWFFKRNFQILKTGFYFIHSGELPNKKRGTN